MKLIVLGLLEFGAPDAAPGLDYGQMPYSCDCVRIQQQAAGSCRGKVELPVEVRPR